MMAASLPTSSTRGPTIAERALEGAINEFQSVLTADELRELHNIKSVPNADAVLVFTAQLDIRNRQRTGPSIASRLYNVLQSVRDFCGVIDVFVSSRPEIAALVWGSVKLTMLVVLNVTSCYEALSKLFLDLGKICPIFRDYSALYPTSKKLQQSLSEFHASIIICCKHVIEFARRPWHSQLFALFANELKPDADTIHERSRNVWDHLALAKAEANLQAQRLQDLERNEASQSRHSMAVFLSRANRDLDETAAWQLRNEEQQARERRQQILDGLSSHDYLTPLKQARGARGSNTARWIFNTPEFDQWINGTLSLLWCSGKIGSGKTILATSVIDHLLTERWHPMSFVSFFFVCFDNQSSLDAETIFRSILRQRLGPDFPKEVETRLKKLDLSFKLPEIINLLHTAFVSDTHYIVIDGVDECEKASRQALLEGLSLLASLEPGAKIFLSSRESLSGEVRKFFPSLQHVSMDCAAMDLDIKSYIEDTINEKIDCEDLIVRDGNLPMEIKQALINGSNGMFLWVVFQVQEICSQHCDEDIRKAIKNLPKDITETFQRATRRIIHRGQKRSAEQIFQWVAGAKRPLNLDELREALAIEVGQQFSNPGRYYNDLHKVALWCENLIRVDEELQLVQFAHHTVLQFLQEKPPGSEFHLALEEINHEIGEICVTYLNFNDFKMTMARRFKPLPPFEPIDIALAALSHEGTTSKITHILHKVKGKSRSKPTNMDDIRRIVNHGDSEGPEATRTQLESHAFLRYASRHWISHTSDFEEGKSRTWPIWKNMVLHGHDLAMKPWEIDNQNVHDSAALRWAYESRHYPLVELLLDRGGPLTTVLSDVMNRSTARGDYDTLSFIISHYDKDSRFKCYFTALVHGVKHNSSGQYNKDSNLHSILEIAVRSGHFKKVQSLLLAGTCFYFNDSDWLTVLQAAALGGHFDIVETLMDGKAYINIIDSNASNGLTALQAAAVGGHLAIVERLFGAGPEVHAPDTVYRSKTVLGAVDGSSQLKEIQRLPISGACVNAGDDNEMAVWGSLPLEHGYVQTGVWSLCPRNPQMKHSERINFAQPFNTRPKVTTWLRSLDMAARRNWCVRVYPTDIDTNGFTIHADSWADSILCSVSVNWLVHDVNHPAITSDRFNIQEIRPFNTPHDRASGIFHFPVILPTAPKVIVAIDSLDCDKSPDLALSLGTSSITRANFTWHLQSLGPIIHMSGASFVAWV
ncbi:hypothetical protein GGR51DRAFT_514909 [Nemania sp. FL0031]|nr:hypothetical protein GGR51DRAFT_514909 [Nemania sp. FL0031]